MSGYNQSETAGQVRIGNWFEELKLKEETGIRYYPSPTDKKNNLLTKSRCIIHTEQVLPKDYKSVNQQAIIDPRSHPDYIAPSKKVGPRQQLLESKIKAEVDYDFKEKEKREFNETRKINYMSSSHEALNNLDFKCSGDLGDRLKNRIQTKNSGYSSDVPITYYGHSVATGKANFPCSFVGSTNPFTKNNSFTADIKKEVIARKTESNERPKPLPTLIEFRNLAIFRNRLIKTVQNSLNDCKPKSSQFPNGSSIRSIIGSIWQNSQSEQLAISQLEKILQDAYGFSLTIEEKHAILSSTDLTSNNNVSLQQLTSLIKVSPSPRRQELVEMFWCNILDPNNNGIALYDSFHSFISKTSRCNELADFFNAVNINVKNQGDLVMEDFFDFYYDVSSEMHNNTDEDFEELLRITWLD